jgi:hypothetical protein
MTTNQHKQEITLINIFTVEAEKQQSAADKVAEIYQTLRHSQFVSRNAPSLWKARHSRH